MLGIARACFLIASLAFIVIGALHLITHFLLLDAPKVASDLQSIADIDIFGTPATAWNLWQATSILMGTALIAIGASNLAVLASQPPLAPPPRAVCMVNIAMLMVIFVMGVLFLGPIQSIGGPVGIILFLLAAFLGPKGRRDLP